MLTAQLIKKMDQLKNALEADPDFLQALQNSAHEPRIEEVHPLITFAQQNGIDITAEELETFFDAMHSPNQELDDALLEMIAGGGAKWYEFWKHDWWGYRKDKDSGTGYPFLPVI